MSIEVKDLQYTYQPKTPYSMHALRGVTLRIEEGDFVAIIGKTGSGKSTFIQHLNALIKLQSGELKVCGIDLSAKKPDYKTLRGKVGMVMQYPEYQLFDETVEKDVSFGPKNIGLPEDEIRARVKEAIELVGLSYNDIKDRSPFELSGGQKRRIAIAGVIAMKPEVLVLDEPTAGLDPKGKKEILALVRNLGKTTSHTIIMISHDMDAVAENCNKVALFYDGQVERFASPSEIFYDNDLITKTELDVPAVAKVTNALKARGIDIGKPITKKEFVEALFSKGGANE